jgi:hypothetical protein
MSEFVETNDGRLINVAHIVTAEWRNGEWRLRLSDGRDAYYRGESFSAMNFNDALEKLTRSHRRTNVALDLGGLDADEPLLSQSPANQHEPAGLND